MTGLAHDPITFSVIQAGLTAAADEMLAVLKKTAMSPIIYEVLDVGTGITDAKGELVSSGAGITTFVGCSTRRSGASWKSKERTRCERSSHKACGCRRCACLTPENCCSRCSVSSWPIRACRISCLPDFVRCDLWAQIAASRRATTRVTQLVETYGVETFKSSLENLFEEGERRARAGLALLPKGTFRIEEKQDDGARWQAEIRITDDTFTAERSGNPDQREAPYNTSRAGAVISSQMIFRALSDPTLAANAGSFRPLKVITREGTIFHATGTAPHGYYFETRIRLHDMLWQCMARALPDRMPAGHFTSICGTVLAGDHPDTGRRFTMVEPQMGGWGATAKHDGLDAMYSASHGETFNCPFEICESRHGIDVGYKRLNENANGRRQHAGGKGLSVSYKPRGRTVLAGGYSRNRIPVWGLNGGTNSIAVRSRDGSNENYAFVSGLKVQPGNEIVISTANGGGWATPT